jgi:hypothetical protein
MEGFSADSAALFVELLNALSIPDGEGSKRNQASKWRRTRPDAGLCGLRCGWFGAFCAFGATRV